MSFQGPSQELGCEPNGHSNVALLLPRFDTGAAILIEHAIERDRPCVSVLRKEPIHHSELSQIDPYLGQHFILDKRRPLSLNSDPALLGVQNREMRVGVKPLDETSITSGSSASSGKSRRRDPKSCR